MNFTPQDHAVRAEPVADSTDPGREEPASPERKQTRGTLEVVPRAKRRTFTAAYKQKILAEVETAADEPGGVGKILRREGLYSSHLVEWRRAAEEGARAALQKKRGRKVQHDPTSRENEQLRRRVAQLEENLRKAEIIISVQKKVASLLGTPIPEDEQ